MVRGTSPAAPAPPVFPKYMGLCLAVVPCTSNGVSFGEGVVMATGAVAASIAIAERDGASITGPNYGQPFQH